MTLDESLNTRIKRLNKLLEINAPKLIICTEIMLVFKAAFAAYPKFMGYVFTSWVREVASSEVATCPHCLKYMPHEQHICESCLDNIVKETEKGNESNA
jgi:hypothetical protein